ncbi:MAG: hypothetical protein ACLP19_27150 [Xanthobacteraceae bacterium]
MLFNPKNVNTLDPLARDLNRRRGLTKSQRAGVAASIVLKEIPLGDLRLRQIAKLAGVSVPYIYKAMSLSPLQRAGLRKGWLRVADIPTVPTDKQLKALVKAAGVARVWDAIVPFI